MKHRPLRSPKCSKGLNNRKEVAINPVRLQASHPIVIKKTQIKFSASTLADYSNNSASASHPTSESVLTRDGLSKSESIEEEVMASPS